MRDPVPVGELEHRVREQELVPAERRAAALRHRERADEARAPRAVPVSVSSPETAPRTRSFSTRDVAVDGELDVEAEPLAGPVVGAGRRAAGRRRSSSRLPLEIDVRGVARAHDVERAR